MTRPRPRGAGARGPGARERGPVGSRRSAATPVHVLPSRARDRSAGRAHAPHRRPAAATPRSRARSSLGKATLAQRLVRAQKEKIKDAGIPYAGARSVYELPERLEAVLTASSTSCSTRRAALDDAGGAARAHRARAGSDPARARPRTTLAPDEPEVEGLLALLLLQRRCATVDEGGGRHARPARGSRDRARWDRGADHGGRRPRRARLPPRRDRVLPGGAGRDRGGARAGRDAVRDRLGSDRLPVRPPRPSGARARWSS